MVNFPLLLDRLFCCRYSFVAEPSWSKVEPTKTTAVNTVRKLQRWDGQTHCQRDGTEH
jgi:hypothetical protein